MGASQELIERVRAQAAGTPYVVEPSAEGFAVRLDLGDAKWYGLMSEQHLASTWTYRVALDEPAKTMTITDEVRDVRWETVGGGVQIPVAGSVAVRKGRIEEKRFSFTVGGDGGGAQPNGLTFDSGEGRELIRKPAKALGWHEKLGREQKIGAIVGFGTLALIFVAGIIVGIVALAGGFS